MNRLAGFALIAGFLASSGAASGSLTKHATQERDTRIAPLAVQQPLASVVQSLAAPAATLAPATASQRVIHAAQATTPGALVPASGEPAGGGQGPAIPRPPPTNAPARPPPPPAPPDRR